MEQSNALAPRLDDGDVLFGAGIETGSPRLVEIYGALGLDWAWIDLEHKNTSGLDSTELEHLTRAAECADIELIVRLPGNDQFLVRKILDAGVRNICIPRVESADDIRNAVEAARFVYNGGPGARGLAMGRSSGYGTAYTKSPDDDYHEVEDENILVGALIENERVVDEIDEILDVPELGFVFPGPGDLGVSLGHTLDYGNSAVAERIETVRQASVDADVPLKGVFGSHFGDRTAMQEAPDQGYQLIGLGNDFRAIQQVFSERLEWFE